MLTYSPPPAAPAAEVREALAGCDGTTVSAVVVRSEKPSGSLAAERVAAVTSEALGLVRQHTRAYVIRAYLLLREGEPCTEQRRADSERLLRAQRFVASAAVRTVPDGDGFVLVLVHVVDELPWVAATRFRGANLDALEVGTLNLRGRGVTVVLGASRGMGYRPGGSVLVGQSGALGRAALADAEWQRRPLGAYWRLTYAEPFLIDGQREAFHLGALQEVGYPTLWRPNAEDVVVHTRRTAYHAGWIGRVGSRTRGGRVALGGVMLLGTEVRTGTVLSLRGEAGLVPTTDSTLVGRYRAHANGRIGLVGGVRRLRFRTVTRFETLRTEQDVASGYAFDLLVAPSINRSAGARDLLVGGDVYVGRDAAASLLSMTLRMEGRITGRRDAWEGVVLAAGASWIHLPSQTRTRSLTLTAASLRHLAFPAQLTFRDADGGLLAFAASGESGGTRAVLRVEERQLLPWWRRRVGLAAAVFADVGQLWAGDAPFGVRSPLRGSFGLSVLGAYPVTSKRTVRVDVAVPVNRGPRDARFVIRLRAGDRTGGFASEPQDVWRARAAAAPVALVRW